MALADFNGLKSVLLNVLFVCRHQFRAKPLNAEIFASATHGIKKVVPRECTMPQEFRLEIDERLRQRHCNDVVRDNQSEFEFRARPVPRDILRAPVVCFGFYSALFLCSVCSAPL